MEPRKQNCDIIQALLIQKNFDELDQKQNESVFAHLKTCPGCQNFQNVLSRMNELTDLKNETGLEPPEAIYQKLHQRVAMKKVRHFSVFRESWEWLRSIMDYRIPVYQLLSAGILVLLFFFIFRQFLFSDTYRITANPTVSTMEMPIIETVQVINPDDILKKQSIGQSVKEDTALYRFVVTAM